MKIDAAINIRKNETLSKLLKTIKQKSIRFAVVSMKLRKLLLNVSAK
jgi:hypothetical protein